MSATGPASWDAADWAAIEGNATLLNAIGSNVMGWLAKAIPGSTDSGWTDAQINAVTAVHAQLADILADAQAAAPTAEALEAAVSAGIAAAFQAAFAPSPPAPAT